MTGSDQPRGSQKHLAAEPSRAGIGRPRVFRFGNAPKPAGFYTKVCFAWENAGLVAHERSSIPDVAISRNAGAVHYARIALAQKHDVPLFRELRLPHRPTSFFRRPPSPSGGTSGTYLTGQSGHPLLGKFDAGLERRRPHPAGQCKRGRCLPERVKKTAVLGRKEKAKNP